MKSRKLLSQTFLELVLRTDAKQQDNLLGTLLLAAQDCRSQIKVHSKKLLRLIDFLERNDIPLGDDARLTFGFSRTGNSHGERVSDRLIFSTRGIPSKERIGFVSSRLGHSPDQNPNWFDTVRTVCARMDQSSQSLVCTHKTAGVEFYRRAAYLFGLDRIDVTFDDGCEELGSWLFRLPDMMLSAEQPPENVDPQLFSAFVSPILSDTETTTPENFVNVYDRDSFHAFFCDVVYALRVSDSGNMRKSIERRLLTINENPCVIFLSSSNESASEKTREHLLRLGALHYHLVSADTDESDGKNRMVRTVTTRTKNREFPARILKMNETMPLVADWLTHCTRRRIGPWPDEDLATYTDDLLFRRVGANHSALAALCRIVRTARLVSTSDLIRGTKRVVSFSARPLDELLAARTFRSHLSRWDYEPYGICIARESMEKMEARPVIYAIEDEYTKLRVEDRPFFQKLPDKTSIDRGDSVVDWSDEQEWRKQGDVLLDDIPREHGIVFVPTLAEARFIIPFTRFDVCVTDS